MQASGNRFRSLPAFVFNSLHAGGFSSLREFFLASPVAFAKFSSEFCCCSLGLVGLHWSVAPKLSRRWCSPEPMLPTLCLWVVIIVLGAEVIPATDDDCAPLSLESTAVSKFARLKSGENGDIRSGPLVENRSECACCIGASNCRLPEAILKSPGGNAVDVLESIVCKCWSRFDMNGSDRSMYTNSSRVHTHSRCFLLRKSGGWTLCVESAQ